MRVLPPIAGIATINCETFDAALMHGEHNVPESLLGDVLPLLLQETGELLPINRQGVVFNHSSSKNIPHMLDGRKIRRVAGPVRAGDPLVLREVCDDPSSVRSGIVVLGSDALSCGLQSRRDEGVAHDLVHVV